MILTKSLHGVNKILNETENNFGDPSGPNAVLAISLWDNLRQVYQNKEANE